MTQHAARCESCSSAQPITDGSTIIGYECHHNAPTPLMPIAAADVLVSAEPVWPVLKSSDWCADFTRKEKS